MSRFLATAATVTVLSAPAFAGNLTAPEPDPIPMEPAPVAYQGNDWTGAYGGLSLGNLNVDGSGAADGDDLSYGAHLGYDYDFGQFVVGGELEYSATDLNLGAAASVDSVARAKLRAGYDAGRALVYVTGGAAQIDTSLGNDTGVFGGVGLTYMVTDRFYVGGEVLQHRFEDIGGSAVDADATSISIRGGMRF